MANTELGFPIEQMTPIAILAELPVRVVVVGHSLSNNQFVRATNLFKNQTGMQQLNNQLFRVLNITTNSFHLYDQFYVPIDGRSYTPFIASGIAQFTLTGPSLDMQNLNTQEDI